MQGVIDTGAEINVVSAHAAAEWRLRYESATLPIPKWLANTKAYCYGACYIPFTITDSWGTTKDTHQLFYVLEKEGPPLLWGMHGIDELNIAIFPSQRTWRFEIIEPKMQIEGLQDFEKSMENEEVYCIILSNVGAVDAGPTRLRGEDDAQVLPKEVADYADVASEKAAGILPENKVTDHAIEIEGEPPYGPLYNLSTRELETLRRYLDDALAKGWIRHSTSPAGAPVLFVPKKDGTLRLCVDYRALNKITISNRHALPLISETLDRLAGAKVFTKLDLKDAYHRIRIRRGDEWKTAFRTRYGHFEYTVMPFGLSNAPATFQAYINRAMAGIIDVFCVVYLDDILIYSQDLEEHWKQVRQVLWRLRKYSLYINRKKCEFATRKVEFLGFIISEKGVEMDRQRVETIELWPTPKTFRDIQVFIGFTNFYRRFIHQYSKIAGPLTSLLKGSKNGKKAGLLIWTAVEESAFRLLIEAFTKAPLLAHFEYNRYIRLETDASGYALAAIISQLIEDAWHPIAFYSRKMTSAELNYDTHDKELLAIIEAFKHWRHYLEGSIYSIQVLTDHDNLKGFANKKELSSRQSRWAMRLSAFDFNITHRPGSTNPADAPSRRRDFAGAARAQDLLPTLQKKLALISQIEIENSQRIILAGLISVTHKDLEGPLRVEGLREPAQCECCTSGVVTQAHPIGSVANTTLNPATGVIGREQFIPRILGEEALLYETVYEDENKSMRDLILICQREDAQAIQIRNKLQDTQNHNAGSLWSVDHNEVRFNGKLYVPPQESIRMAILKRYHDDPLAGHFGVGKTLELVQRKYNWSGLKRYIEDYISECDVCQRTKARRHRVYGDLQSLRLPSAPWQELSWDFIVGLPPGRREQENIVYDSILVVLDRYTKMALYIPCTKTLKAKELADIFYNTIVCRFGMPMGIVSDRGSLFTSEYWSELCYYWRIKRRLSTAFHPQTDGQTERQNQTLEHYLRVYCTEQQTNWIQLLPMAEFAYNNAKHATIGCSPFYALYGYHPEVYIDVEDDAKGGKIPAIEERLKKVHHIRQLLEIRWKQATDMQAKYFNKKHNSKSYNIGDHVLLSTQNLSLAQPNKKLTHKFIGPFRIRDIIGKQAYRLDLPKEYSRLHNVFHVSLLEPYHRRAGEAAAPLLKGPDLVDNEEEWEIEALLDRRTRKGQIWYKVRWKDWPSDYDQWIEKENLDHASELRESYDSAALSKRRRR